LELSVEDEPLVFEVKHFPKFLGQEIADSGERDEESGGLQTLDWDPDLDSTSSIHSFGVVTPGLERIGFAIFCQ